MKIAANVGQMHNEKGLQYVGNGEGASSHRKLQEFLSQKFDEHADWKSQIKKVTMIDVHSGDSMYGVDKLLTDKFEDSLKLKMLFLDYDDKDLIQSLKSDRMRESTQFLDGIYDDVNGYTFGYGQFIADLTEHKAEDMDILPFASEFGSNHMLETVGFCGLLENAYFQEYQEYVQREDVDENVRETMETMLKKSKSWLKDVFYVQHPEWKKLVVQRGLRVFSRCVLR